MSLKQEKKCELLAGTREIDELLETRIDDVYDADNGSFGPKFVDEIEMLQEYKTKFMCESHDILSLPNGRETVETALRFISDVGEANKDLPPPIEMKVYPFGVNVPDTAFTALKLLELTEPEKLLGADADAYIRESISTIQDENKTLYEKLPLKYKQLIENEDDDFDDNIIPSDVANGDSVGRYSDAFLAMLGNALESTQQGEQVPTSSSSTEGDIVSGHSDATPLSLTVDDMVSGHSDDTPSSSTENAMFSEQIHLIDIQIASLVDLNTVKFTKGRAFIGAFPDLFAKNITTSIWGSINNYANALIGKIGSDPVPFIFTHYEQVIECIERVTKLNEFIISISGTQPLEKIVEFKMDILNLLCALYSPLHHVEYTVSYDYDEIMNLLTNLAHKKGKSDLHSRFTDLNSTNGNQFKITEANGDSPFPLIPCWNNRMKVSHGSVELFRISFVTGKIDKLIGELSSHELDESIFDECVINRHINGTSYEVGDFFKSAFLTSLKYIRSSKNPIKTATEKMTADLTQNSLTNFIKLNEFFSSLLNPKLMATILNYIEVNGDRFCIRGIQFPEGVTNMNPAFHAIVTGNKKVIKNGNIHSDDATNPVQMYTHSDPSKLSYNELNEILNVGTLENMNRIKHLPVPPVKFPLPGDIAMKTRHNGYDYALKERLKRMDNADAKRDAKRENETLKRAEELGDYIPILKQLSWSDFKKYLENYIVNFTTNEQLCLKHVTFLKMMHLNKIMCENAWGFIDIAGGSLFNFLQAEFVVTADYDFKIYFNDEGIPPEVLQDRETYIKLCAINLGINLNNLMMNKKFFKTCQINGRFGFIASANEIIDIGYLFEITPASGRYFSSRGKEPELFPVPLYSSDFFLSATLYSHNGYNSSTKFCVSYEDLVFKHMGKHYLHKFLKHLENPDDETIRIIQNTFVLGLYEQEGYLTIRVPSLWEIITDVTSLLIVPELTLGRLSVNKSGKDKIRKIITEDISGSLYATTHKFDDCTQEKFEQGLCDDPDSPQNTKILQIIKSAFGTKNRNGYFQEKLFNHALRDEFISEIVNSITNVINPVCKLHWYMLALLRKYSEFKNATDYARLSTYQNVDFINESDIIIKVFEQTQWVKKNNVVINDYVAVCEPRNQIFQIEMTYEGFDLQTNPPIFDKKEIENGTPIKDTTIDRIIAKITNGSVIPLYSEHTRGETENGALELFTHVVNAMNAVPARARGGARHLKKRVTFKKRYVKMTIKKNSHKNKKRIIKKTIKKNKKNKKRFSKSLK